MARKKPTFKCYQCKKNLGSAASSFSHFRKNPAHRNARQQKDYKQNMSLKHRKKLRKIGTLPTVQRGGRMKAVRSMKYCTDCGSQRKATHRFCGGCGQRLTA